MARGDFIRLADADIDDKALGIHDKAKAILDAQTATPPAAGAPKVADFGLTADELIALQNRIAACAEIVQSPRAATIKISTATEAIAARFAAADDLLSMTLDKLAPRFKKSARLFLRLRRRAGDRGCGEPAEGPRACRSDKPGAESRAGAGWGMGIAERWVEARRPDAGAAAHARILPP